MAIKDFGKVGVLMGGPSSEREISLKSGAAVLEALIERKVNAIGIDIKDDDYTGNTRLLKDEQLDCAFIALHGRFGEDGQIQNILERVRIPYTGSGPKASKLAMDKIESLGVFQANGLIVPKSCFLEKKDYRKAPNCEKELGLPLVIKPANHGSSIGLTIARRIEELSDAIGLAFRFDSRVVIQEYIRGRELTVGVLDERPLPVIEIVPKKSFFDFEAKYQSGLTDYILPAKLDESLSLKLQEIALIAHKSLGCFGCSRADIILSKNNVPYILEVNTIPGMTATSLLPKAAKAIGIDFGDLCVRLLELAYEKEKD